MSELPEETANLSLFSPQEAAPVKTEKKPMVREIKAPKMEVAQLSDTNDEFPVHFSNFVKSLVGTDDEVWTKLIQSHHGHENHKPVEWHKIIDSYRNLKG